MSTVDNKMNRNMRSPLEARGDCLDSWKEIAVYLRREVRTVQRWEKREGLPVHRQFHTKAGTVCAFKQEIDAWLKNRRHPSNEAVLQVRHWNQSVDWSSPMTLVARCAGENCSLWLVVAPGSRRLESDSGIGTIDGNADGRKTLPQTDSPAPGLSMTTRDSAPLSSFVACAHPRRPATLARVSPKSNQG